MTIYLVSETGLLQIEDWIRTNSRENHIDYMDSLGMSDFVSRYASEAESSTDHLIEMPARLSKFGCPVTMIPEMRSIEVED